MNILKKLGITPGPWKWGWVEDHMPQLEGNVEYSDMNPILISYDCGCKTREHDKACPLRPTEADRNLIAMAPEMLEALIEFVIDVEISYGSKKEDFLKNTKPVINLIEKATGKTWEEIKELLK